MKLHETINMSNFAVTRTAGGWIYFDKSAQISTFVPFNNEFMENSDIKFIQF